MFPTPLPKRRISGAHAGAPLWHFARRLFADNGFNSSNTCGGAFFFLDLKRAEVAGGDGVRDAADFFGIAVYRIDLDGIAVFLLELLSGAIAGHLFYFKLHRGKIYIYDFS